MSVKSVPATDRSIRDKMIEEAFDLTRAIVADPTILDEIPDGAGIVLIREDADADYVEASISAGLDAIRRGENVYFRHVKAGEWTPPATEPVERASLSADRSPSELDERELADRIEQAGRTLETVLTFLRAQAKDAPGTARIMTPAEAAIDLMEIQPQLEEAVATSLELLVRFSFGQDWHGAMEDPDVRRQARNLLIERKIFTDEELDRISMDAALEKVRRLLAGER